MHYILHANKQVTFNPTNFQLTMSFIKTVYRHYTRSKPSFFLSFNGMISHLRKTNLAIDNVKWYDKILLSKRMIISYFSPCNLNMTPCFVRFAIVVM